MADIVHMPTSLTVLADRIRAVLEAHAATRAQWFENTLQLCSALAEARERFPSQRHFSVWLAENELDNLNRDDRAALIQMGQPRHIEATKRVLQETQRNSYRLIWREEVEPQLRNAANTDSATASPAKRRAITRKKAEPEQLPVSDVEAAARLLAGLDAMVRAFDTLDLAAARRGLTVHQRRDFAALMKRVRNWLDVLEISK